MIEYKKCFLPEIIEGGECPAIVREEEERSSRLKFSNLESGKNFSQQIKWVVFFKGTCRIKVMQALSEGFSRWDDKALKCPKYEAIHRVKLK